MKTDYRLELITPCFCAGADQGKAEIRPPSIRGELRWWFRVLGGSPEDERTVFGGVHHDPKASAIVVRVSDVQPIVRESDLPGDKPGRPLFYLGYFLHKSGESEGQRVGRHAFFSPGTSFNLHLRFRQSIDPRLQDHLDRTLQAFTILGSLGSRSTRGFGCWFDTEAILSRREFDRTVTNLNGVHVYSFETMVSDARTAHVELEQFLKQFRKDNGLSGEKPSALGGIKPRQSSALRLRPVKLVEGFLPVVFYTPSTHNQQNIKPLLERHFRNR